MTDNNDTNLDDQGAQRSDAIADESTESIESAATAIDEIDGEPTGEIEAPVADADVDGEPTAEIDVPGGDPGAEADAPDTEIAPASPADLLPTGDAHLTPEAEAQAFMADDVEITRVEAADLLPSGDARIDTDQVGAQDEAVGGASDEVQPGATVE